MAHVQTTTKAIAQFKFLFLMGNDLKQIQNFYQEILQLATDGSPDEGWIGIDLGVHILYFKGDFDIPHIRDWAWQPGYKGGSGNLTSWSLEFPYSEFKGLFKRIQSSGVETLSKTPEWRRDSYWGLTVKDPMGHTIELYATSPNQTEQINWQE